MRMRNLTIKVARRLWDGWAYRLEFTAADVALGSAAFTTLMCLDIFAFGLRFHRYFGRRGKAIAAAIPCIMASGWLLAAELFDPAVAGWLAPAVSAVRVLVAIFSAYGLSPRG
jgi:hypothetical protein